MEKPRPFLPQSLWGLAPANTEFIVLWHILAFANCLIHFKSLGVAEVLLGPREKEALECLKVGNRAPATVPRNIVRGGTRFLPTVLCLSGPPKPCCRDGVCSAYVGVQPVFPPSKSMAPACSHHMAVRVPIMIVSDCLACSLAQFFKRLFGFFSIHDFQP